MSGSTALHGPQSITDLIEKPDREIQRFLDGKPEADDLEQWINNYKAFAVEIAEWVGQTSSEVKQWKVETPTVLLQAARTTFKHVSKDRAGHRRVKELLEVYKSAVRKLERAHRRAVDEEPPQHGNEEDTKENNGMLKRMVSGGFFGLFGASGSKEHCSSHDVIGSNVILAVDSHLVSEGSDVDPTITSQRQIQSDTDYLNKIKENNNSDLKKKEVKSQGMLPDAEESEFEIVEEDEEEQPVDEDHDSKGEGQNEEIVETQLHTSQVEDHAQEVRQHEQDNQMQMHEEKEVDDTLQPFTMLTSNIEQPQATSAVEGNKRPTLTLASPTELVSYQHTTTQREPQHEYEKYSDYYKNDENIQSQVPEEPEIKPSSKQILTEEAQQATSPSTVRPNTGNRIQEKIYEEQYEYQQSDDRSKRHSRLYYTVPANGSTQRKNSWTELYKRASNHATGSAYNRGSTSSQSHRHGNSSRERQHSPRGHHIQAEPSASAAACPSHRHPHQIHQDLEINPQPMGSARPDYMLIKDEEIARLQNELFQTNHTCRDLNQQQAHSSHIIQHLKTQIEMFKKKNHALVEKQQATETRMDQLKSAVMQYRNRLAAANKEIEVLKDPLMRDANETATEEAKVLKALDERKMAVAQMKNVEKLLEEVIGEKDCLIVKQTKLKQELFGVKREKGAFKEEIENLREALTVQTQKIKGLQEEIVTLRVNLTRVNDEKLQAVKQRQDMEMTMDGAVAFREKLEAENMHMKILLRESQQSSAELKDQLACVRKNMSEQEKHHTEELHKLRHQINHTRQELEAARYSSSDPESTQLRKRYEKLTKELDRTKQALKKATEQKDVMSKSHKQVGSEMKEIKVLKAELQKELANLSELATRFSTKNDQNVNCCGCREKGAAIAELSNQVTIYVRRIHESHVTRRTSKENNSTTEDTIATEQQEILKEVEKVSEVISQPGEPSGSKDREQLAKMEERIQQLSVSEQTPDHVEELNHLRREVHRLKKLIELEAHTANAIATVSNPGPDPKELQMDLRRLLRENDWLRHELFRSRAHILNLRTELDEATQGGNPDQEMLKRASVTMERASYLLNRGSKHIADIQEKTTASQQEVNPEANEEGTNVDQEDEKQITTWPREGSRTKSVVIRDAHSGVKEQKSSLYRKDDREKIILELTEQNEWLNEELAALRERVGLTETGEEMDIEEIRETARRAKSEVGHVKEELQKCQQNIDDYYNGDRRNTVAFLVKLREEEISNLKSQIADLERTLVNQNTLLQQNSSINNRRKSKQVPEAEVSQKPSIHGKNKSELLLIMANDSTRLKELNDKLNVEKQKLTEMVQQRDATIAELQSKIQLYETLAADVEAADGDIKQNLKIYTKKLKEGESQLGRLQVQMQVLTRRHSSLMLEKENEIINVRTQYAQQLGKLINDCVQKQECKEAEMNRLCNQLDQLEAANFDMKQQLEKLNGMKNEQVPKLQKELEEKREKLEALQAELEERNNELREMKAQLHVVTAEKEEATERHRIEIRRISRNKTENRDEIDAMQRRNKALLDRSQEEINRLKQELNNKSALAEEREGAAVYWKLKFEDLDREAKDMKEKHESEMNEKKRDLLSLAEQVQELKLNISAGNKVPTDEEFEQLKQQIKDLKSKHVELFARTKLSDKISERDLEKFYNEIGELCTSLYQAAKDKELEEERLLKEAERLRAEKSALSEESSKVIQEKQVEIRRLMTEMTKMEVQAAKLHANSQEEIAKIKVDSQHEVDIANTEKAHLSAVKDEEIEQLQQEAQKTADKLEESEKLVQELRSKLKRLSFDKTEFDSVKDTWQLEMEGLRKEVQQHKSDKIYLEKMVDRLNKEMENRIINIKNDNAIALNNKDDQIRELYGKIEKVAKERGEMMAKMNAALREKEKKVVELTDKLKEFDGVMDKADGEYKNRLEKKNKEVKFLRNEIKKMGTEGVKLLEQREKEINEMRVHLKNVLKVLEEKYKMKASSVDLIGVASKQEGVKVEPLPVKPLKSAKSVKSNKSVPNALKPRGSLTRALSKPKPSVTKQPSKVQPTVEAD